MLRLNTFRTILLITVLVTGFASCSDPYHMDPGQGHESVDPSKYFDFATVYACPINIDIDHKALINVYDVDPDIDPEAPAIYATFTDAKGQYTGTMQIPTAYVGRELWARGFGYEMKARVTPDGITFKGRYGDPRSRSAMSRTEDLFSDEVIEANCHRLYELFLNRLPESRNNTDRLNEIKNLAIYTIDNTEIMFSFVNSGGRYTAQLYYFYMPQEIESKDFITNIIIHKAEEAGVEPDLSSLNLRSEFMRFFTNDAPDPNKKFLLTGGWGCYYTGYNQYLSGESAHSTGDHYVVHDAGGNRLYGNGFLDAPVGTMPTDRLNADKANNIIEQYNGSRYNWASWAYRGYGFVNRNFNNQVGAHRMLRYYGPNYDEYIDEPNYTFPPGYRIGFILKIKNEDNGSLNLFTTNNEINRNGDVQVARYLSATSSEVNNGVTNLIYGYEDTVLEEISGFPNSRTEPDYNDFMFMISSNPAVSTVGARYLTDDGEMLLDGTLLYEDLYPEPGDYDMNDVMIEYEAWIHFDSNNYVTRIDTKFWPINYGAQYNDDFYIELRTDDNKGNTKQWINPTMICSSSELRAMSAGNLALINARNKPTMCVERTFEFTSAQKLHKDSVNLKNLNPFIYVTDTQREVHLTNGRFCGVSDATTAGLTADECKYYPLMIHDGSMLDGCFFPYAMNVPRRFGGHSHEGFTPVTECVYIVLEYQRFLNWMRNPQDEEYKDWYNYYSKWQGVIP